MAVRSSPDQPSVLDALLHYQAPGADNATVTSDASSSGFVNVAKLSMLTLQRQSLYHLAVQLAKNKVRRYVRRRAGDVRAHS